MAGLSKQKQKLLIMEQLFKRRTDEDHALTGNQLIDILSNEGIKAERKTIYDDIATLCDSGLELETTKSGHSNAYFLADRLFQDEELFLLADAVASSKFLTIKKSNELIKKLQTLTSDYKAKQLRRSIYVDNRTKTYNEYVYYNINSVQNGIFNDKDISFKYYEYNSQKKKQLKHGGETYTVSPFQLIWENDNYYLACYCFKHEKICRYRVDRMTEVTVMDRKRRKLTEDEEKELKNQRSLYSMYGGLEENIRIQFDNSLINVVIDKFGEKVICHTNSENTFYINADVQISPPFWGWLFQFGNKAKILSPSYVAAMAKKQLEEIANIYKD
ncbi:MAG: helix-turn-helix transcriptional regulator [Oscillospiraceae bacterium]